MSPDLVVKELSVLVTTSDRGRFIRIGCIV
jgi:hypothetical protein